MQPVQVIGMGHPVINLNVSIDRLPATNRPANRLGMLWQVGGKIATAMSCVGRLGFSSAVIGRVAGQVSDYVRRELAADGVDTSHLLVEPSAEPYFTISLAERDTGGRSFLSAPPPVADLQPGELDRAFIQSAPWLYLWTAGPAELQAAQWCREAGGQVVFDADTYSGDIDRLLPLCGHFIASEFYYEVLFGRNKGYESNLRQIAAKQGPGGVVMVTLGDRGLVGLDERGGYFEQSAFPTRVVDTTGAGDVFHGAYTAGRLAGMDTREAARFGCAASSIKCAYPGGRTGLPTMENVLDFLHNRPWDKSQMEERARRWARLPF